MIFLGTDILASKGIPLDSPVEVDRNFICETLLGQEKDAFWESCQVMLHPRCAYLFLSYIIYCRYFSFWLCMLHVCIGNTSYLTFSLQMRKIQMTQTPFHPQLQWFRVRFSWSSGTVDDVVILVFRTFGRSTWRSMLARTVRESEVISCHKESPLFG